MVRLLPFRPLPFAAAWQRLDVASNPRTRSTRGSRSACARRTRAQQRGSRRLRHEVPARARGGAPGARRDPRDAPRAGPPVRQAARLRVLCVRSRASPRRRHQSGDGLSPAHGRRAADDHARDVRALRLPAAGAAEVQHAQPGRRCAASSSTRATTAPARRMRRARACSSSPATSGTGRSTRSCTRSGSSRWRCWPVRSTTRSAPAARARAHVHRQHRHLSPGRDPARAARAAGEARGRDADRSAHAQPRRAST